MKVNKKFFMFMIVALFAFAQVSFAGGQSDAATNDGPVKVAVFGDQGQNLVPLEWIREEAKAKGIDIDVIGVPFTSVYEKLKTEFIGGTGAYDLVIFYPAYLGEFAEFKYIQPLDQYFSLYDPKLDDIVPAFKDLYCSYKGSTYALPYDGDVLNFYFRKDLFADTGEKAAFKARYGRELQVPKTWNDLLQVADFFTRKKGDTLMGKVLDQDFYGFSFFGARGFSYAWWGNIFASLGGAYFDRNLKPQINSPAGIEALNILQKLKAFSPPDVMNMGYEELKNAFLQGRLATMVQWSDVWKKSNDPATSKIVGNAGIATMPGVKQADGSIYYRAAAPVGRVLAIPTTSKHPKEAYWIAWKLSTDISTRCVSSKETGLDPYRLSHVKDAAAFQKFGTTEQAKDYLSVVMKNLNHLFPDLNIPGSGEYLDVLDIAVTSSLSGSGTPKANLDNAAAEWDKISNTLGFDKQKAIYNNMLDIWKKYGFWKD